MKLKALQVVNKQRKSYCQVKVVREIQSYNNNANTICKGDCEFNSVLTP